MSRESVQFAMMIRVGARLRQTHLRLFCETCARETEHSLATETELDEIYACPHCGRRKAYRVR